MTWLPLSESLYLSYLSITLNLMNSLTLPSSLLIYFLSIYIPNCRLLISLFFVTIQPNNFLFYYSNFMTFFKRVDNLPSFSQYQILSFSFFSSYSIALNSSLTFFICCLYPFTNQFCCILSKLPTFYSKFYVQVSKFAISPCISAAVSFVLYLYVLCKLWSQPKGGQKRRIIHYYSFFCQYRLDCWIINLTCLKILSDSNYDISFSFILFIMNITILCRLSKYKQVNRVQYNSYFFIQDNQPLKHFVRDKITLKQQIAKHNNNTKLAMSARYQYDTLNVSLQTEIPNRNPSKLVKTLDYDAHSEHEQDHDSDQKVKRFRELYYKNEKLRRQLKALNEKLNQRLQKVKLPMVSKNQSYRRKALSVDLSQPVKPPNKAQQRELQNAYRQVKMYKQQIEVLKIKEDTPQSYQKLRSMENSITYRDKQISQVQEQLKSIKNVKKLQQRKIVTELQNEDVIQRISQYENQIKTLRQKQKEMANKARKREQQYKKQQAYQIALEKKLRNDKADEQQQKHDNFKQEQIRREITDMEWKIIRQEIQNQRISKDEILIKVQTTKKHLKLMKDQHKTESQNLKEKEGHYRNLLIKLESLRTLIRQQQRIERQREKQKERQKEKIRMQQIQKLRKKMQQGEQDNSSLDDSLITPKEESKRYATRDRKDQREWKGKTRKVQHGFMAPTDQRFQTLGKLNGLKVFLDQNQYICGLGAIIQQDSENTIQKQIFGNHTNIQLKWETPQNDEIKKILGCFSQQGYLCELNLVSEKGMSAKFGKNISASQNVFNFVLESNQHFEGIFGSFRKLNKDVRITELGLWITKESKAKSKNNQMKIANENQNRILQNGNQNSNYGQSKAMHSSQRQSENVSF